MTVSLMCVLPSLDTQAGTKGGAATIGDAARSNIPQPHARHLLADHKRLYASLHWSCTFVGNGCGTAQACFHNY
eukprot:m.184489 g.184489  ORF g.184489 m.184489 type:complete len:74 (-) comp16669_c5_seq1:653-874(-)